MTDVYKQRREELEKHYLKEEAKVCTFNPASLTAPARGKALLEASKLTRNTAPASSEALHSRSMSVVRDAEEREPMRGVREASRLFQGLEEGAWLQGDATDSATTEAALGELHSSIFCLERSERSLANSLLLHSSAAGGRAEGGGGGGGGGQSLPHSRDSQRPPSVSANALQLSAEFAALLSSSQNLASRDQERASRARAPATPAAAAVASGASVSFRDDLIRASRQMTDAHQHAQAASAHLSIYAKVMFVHTHTHTCRHA
jgi:hypothetical protein